jgi:sugar phosphate isomerase/epimerase
MVEFSSADFTFPVLSHEKALETVALLDFKWVDIGLFQDRSHVQPSDQLTAPEANGNKLKSFVQGKGLEISDIFFQAALDFKSCAINHPDSAVRKAQQDLFERGVAYAAAAECSHYSALPGVDFGTSDTFDICAEELSRRVEFAGAAGITYAVEAHIGSIMETPDFALAMLRKVPGLKLALDHSHFTYQGFTAEDVKPLVPYAAHVHARGAAKGVMQSSVAENETDFDAVVRHLKEENYGGRICIEYTYVDWEHCNRTDNISESLILRQKLSDIFARP